MLQYNYENILKEFSVELCGINVKATVALAKFNDLIFEMTSKYLFIANSGNVTADTNNICTVSYAEVFQIHLIHGSQRVQEHSQQGYSSLYKHSSDLCHQIDYSNPAVISVDNNDYRLQIKEALKIKDLKLIIHLMQTSGPVN